jgi:DNA polymerase-1
MSNSRLLDLFNNLDKEEEIPQYLSAKNRILIVDGMNTFLRAFAGGGGGKFNAIGHHVSGITGFLQSLGAAVREIKPTKCILAWDGEKGSQSRKYLCRDYKSNRDNTSIIKKDIFSSKTEEEESKQGQILRLVDYLNCLPLTMIVKPNLEMDDIAAILVKYLQDKPDTHVYIMSTDQDFYQLVCDNVTVYKPKEKQFITEQQVLDKYNIHPVNFSIFKSLNGDVSDNLSGISGLGEKTIPKLFPALSTTRKVTLKEIYETCEKKPSKSVLYARVLYCKSTLETMFKIMDLHDVNVADEDKEEVIAEYEGKINLFDRKTFLALHSEDRLYDTLPNVVNWLKVFELLSSQK